jgi:hypothetical protein
MQTRFMPVLCEEALPWSLWMRFELEERDRLLAVLQFLRPITGRCPERAGYVRVIPTPAEDAELQAFEWAVEARHPKTTASKTRKTRCPRLANRLAPIRAAGRFLPTCAECQALKLPFQ